MKLHISVLLLLFSSLALAQKPAPLITDIPYRTTVSLDGQWHFVADPYDSGSFTYDGKINENSFFRNAHPRSKSDLVEYNFDASPILKVPGDWNTQRPELMMYEGTIWYERNFTYHPQPGKRVFLYVGAANYLSRVGVNGSVVCDHQGGFTPYNCEVTSLLHDGENFVVIQVNDVRRKENVPTLSTDWWNYGGITRDVELVEVPQQFIQDFSLHLGAPFKPSVGLSGEVITGWVKMSDPTAGKPVTVRIPEASLEKTVTTDANGVAPVSFPATNLKLWSPEDPKLYRVEIASGEDKVEDEIGFRTIEVKGQDILLNGRPIFLKGVSIHEEAPYRSGRAFSDDDARTLLGWAKELGANYVRLAHYPHNENMVRMAERMGLMVWSEVPVYWTIDWENPATLANAEQQITDSITRDKNRANIIIWSVGNETPILPARNTFMHQMVDTVRKLDNTRLVSAALQVHKVEGNTRILDDPLGADLDVLGCNEYIGWYEGGFDDIDKAVYKTPYNKPLVMSEFGAGAVYGLHGDADTRWTEEFQAAVFEHQTKMLDRITFLRGTTPWILMDFRSPRRWLPGVQDFYNRKGLVSDQGQKKKAFYVMQKWYESK
ncbi:MAG TPA: glycoside hydrolase family 2 TIM barrel-domain containing protein [Terriglobales bacterium]|nr:glycoside hydrolase family 2 TIM barrel-domain containing protein [Terriglobales bacterium]